MDAQFVRSHEFVEATMMNGGKNRRGPLTHTVIVEDPSHYKVVVSGPVQIARGLLGVSVRVSPLHNEFKWSK